jgi:hypothetical protein
VKAIFIGLLLLGSSVAHSLCEDYTVLQEAYINCVSDLKPTAYVEVQGHYYVAYRASYDLWLVYKDGALIYYSKTEVSFV